ncbi:F-box/LRR-repeat protein 2 [Pyricularia oryzae]|uniref:Uncharacterized protein n=3 Tax=Pyricularia oryzae TaxID=318829 RepID=A0A4P7NDW0_PYROR|nr:F-box/LRR-repeat protein 2 [Pyricularia oryzae Y34]KAH8848153.1 hypothetical protein MCOR01_001540 [Pyricularia oryzae]KAI6252648.1 hypothetical protein MCOR19_010749 [Pyricularia oryzae]KAI6325779.1 hypothetical protein MCOR30_006647 [Pyricularia oryzae]KAI6344485.1 hypothetical protein MCOR28_004234 [Pyricularia oryzae]
MSATEIPRTTGPGRLIAAHERRAASSIDSSSSHSRTMTVPEQSESSHVESELQDVIEDTPKKPKTRHSIFRGISRIASSPAMGLGLGHSRSASVSYSSGSSISSVSLSTASSSSPYTPTSTSSYFPSSDSPLEREGAGSSSGSGTSSPGCSPGQWSPEEIRVRQLNVESLPHNDNDLGKSSIPAELVSTRKVSQRRKESWASMPLEIKIHILSHLNARELVLLARVSKELRELCFDGQLWTTFDASSFYKRIPSHVLTNTLVRAGSFVQHLNLRGCIQLSGSTPFDQVPKLCTNLHTLTLEGCFIKRNILHSLLESNVRLERINLTGLKSVCNSTCRIIAEMCPRLQVFNVSFCTDLDARGIKSVLDRCPLLTDVRAAEVRGFERHDVAAAIFRATNLTRLTLNGCREIDDASFKIMLLGTDPKFDLLTDLPMVPPRKWRHLGLSYCDGITNEGFGAMGHLVPDLESLELSRCGSLSDAGLGPVLATTPRLTRLDLEDCALLTNTTLSTHLAKAPCAPLLKHLTVSHCENLGDAGLMPVVRACKSLQVLEMDNTRASDLVICELSAMIRARSKHTTQLPQISLRVVAYDCSNITWMGIREVLSRNCEAAPRARKQASQNAWRAEAERVYALIEEVSSRAGPQGSGQASVASETNSTSAAKRQSKKAGVNPSEAPKQPSGQQTYPSDIIGIKCYYAWQQTVDEHTKRVLAGELTRASRLERSWAAWMQADEEQEAGGGIRLTRRRRTRAREAQMVHADEEVGGNGAGVRRRARTASSCVVM